MADHSVLVHSDPAGRTAELRPRLKMRSPSNRSRVTTGKAILPGIDGRSAVARRYHDLVASIASDQGGAQRLSEARLQLIRRLPALSVQLEQSEARLASGEQINMQEYATLTSTLVRVVTRLGINRVARDVTPTLSEYLAKDEGP